MSYYHFMDIFKQQLGITPGQYKMTQRMNLAQQMLRLTDIPIKKIAFQTGFSNRFHFSKAFKQFFKLPPAAYRKCSTQVNLQMEYGEEDFTVQPDR